MRQRWLGFFASLLVLAALLTEATRATCAQDAWVGRRVMFKDGVTVMLGARRIDPHLISLPATVTKAQGGWLWVERGWVEARYVVTLDVALDYYTREIQTDPTAWAYSSRGIVWDELGEVQNAIADYDEALRLDPQNAPAWNRRAWLWATCPEERYRDGKRAVATAHQACALTSWSDGWYVETLAAVYAEAGDFEKAVEQQTRSLEFNAVDDAERPEREARLALYQSGQRYREPAAEPLATSTP